LVQIFFTTTTYAGQSDLIKLGVDYHSEHKDSKTIHLNATQRKKYALTVNYRGLLLDGSGSVLDTRHLPNGTAMFVYGKDGVLYVSKSKSITKFTHASLVADEDVIVAGTISVRRGRVKFMTDISPRYVTKTEGNLKAAKYRLKVMGADLRALKLFFHFNL
jgi:hypothetical protein